MRSSCKCARLSPVKLPVAERNVHLLRFGTTIPIGASPGQLEPPLAKYYMVQ